MNKNITDLKEKEAIRFLEWLQYQEEVSGIIDNGGFPVSQKEYIKVIEELEKEGFYEAIIIILYTNRTETVIERALKKLITKTLVEEWTNKGTKEFCENIKKYIRKDVDYIKK